MTPELPVLIYNIPDQCLLRGYTVRRCPVQHLQICPEIGMREDIPHSCHLFPCDIRMCIPDFFGNILCRFTDDDQFVTNGADGLFIGRKLFTGHILYKETNFFHRIEDICKINAGIPHAYFTSARTDFLSSSRSARSGTMSTRWYSCSSRKFLSLARSKRSASSEKSTRRSMSLSGRCSDRAYDPKSPILFTL